MSIIKLAYNDRENMPFAKYKIESINGLHKLKFFMTTKFLPYNLIKFY